jgi:hypothetical protein
VQITLNGNKISTTGGNQLVADLTGDNLVDLFPFAGNYDLYLSNKSGRRVSAYVNGGFVFASFYGFRFFVGADFAIVGGVGVAVKNGFGVQSTEYLNPITFSDARINGGATTSGWLEVNAFNTSTTDHTVQLTRLIFDDASIARPEFTSIPGTQTEWTAAVPEPSSLGLLALGAGGLTLRHRHSPKAKAA